MKLSESLIMFTVTGADHPGITKSLMKIVSQANLKLKDMGQTVTFATLSLSFVVEFPEDNETKEQVVKDLLFEANRMGLQLEYKSVKTLEKNHIHHENKFTLNLVSSQDIPSQFLAEMAEIFTESNINIYRIDKLSKNDFTSLEISTTVPESVSLKEIKKRLLNASTKSEVDLAFLKDNVFRRSKRLIVFDMDSTLIQTEVIDEMAKIHGVGDEVISITERAMNGEIDFDESLKQRVSKLKGLDVSQLKEIAQNLPLTSGTKDFIATVKSLGYKTAIISGGFTFFAEHLKNLLQLDYAFANELEILNNKLTGEIVGPIINAEQKALLLKVLAQQEQISLEQVVAIGDGANDLPMLSIAGLGIAYHAKEIVKRNAPHHMGHGPMTSILYFLGIPGTQIK